MDSPQQDSGIADEALVRAAQAGDRTSFDRLIERHHGMVFGLIVRVLGDREAATDATQDAFVKAYTGLKHFRGEAKFTTWLYRIALNQARSVIRKRKAGGPKVFSMFSRRDDDDTRTEEVSDLTYEPSAAADRRETARTIHAVLDTLDDDDRELIVLRDVDGMSYEAIAELLEKPLGTVKSTLHRARLKFVARYRLVADGAAGAPELDRGVLGS